MEEGLDLGLDGIAVRALAEAVPGSIVANAVEGLGIPGAEAVADVGDDIAVEEVVPVEVAENSLNGAYFVIHRNLTADKVPAVLAYTPGQRFAYQHIRLGHEILRAALHYGVLREDIEEIRIGLHPLPRIDLFARFDGGLPAYGRVGCGCGLGDVHQHLFLIPIGQAYVVAAVQGIHILPFRGLVRHLILLDHIAAYQDDERQAHGKPHRLDDGVELVAGQEFKITAHRQSSFLTSDTIWPSKRSIVL